MDRYKVTLTVEMSRVVFVEADSYEEAGEIAVAQADWCDRNGVDYVEDSTRAAFVDYSPKYLTDKETHG